MFVARPEVEDLSSFIHGSFGAIAAVFDRN